MVRDECAVISKEGFAIVRVAVWMAAAIVEDQRCAVVHGVVTAERQKAAGSTTARPAGSEVSAQATSTKNESGR